MSDMNIFLDQVHISNFLSLQDVDLPLKPLTILVGPNASGKSNVLKALDILGRMMTRESLPSADDIQKWLWAGGADKISFELVVKANHKRAGYKLELQAQTENPISVEELIVDEIEVISIRGGHGEVTDENDTNSTVFHSTKLALKSAGDYGNKPVTKALADFIRNWELYNFRPSEMRRGKITASAMRKLTVKGLPTRMDNDGEALGFLLYEWGEKDKARFQAVSEALNDYCKLGIGQEGDELYLLEGYKNHIPLEMASDGTLRLLAYQVLLIEPESPSLIAIEEPERNLHPAALTQLASLLKRLSKKTQVIITTHSAQLLDAFDADDLSDDVNVLLLRNRPGSGTKIIHLGQIQRNRVSFRDWVEEFGIGSAIFDSQLLQDIVEA